MNPTMQNPLAALKDIHLPLAPSWWPPAPGWWIVSLLLLTLISFALYKWRQRQLRQRPIKLALAEFYQLDLNTDDPEQQRQILQDLSALIRRFCIVFFPQQPIAGLCGQAWLGFLKQEFSGKIKGKEKQFTDQELLPLIEDAYSPTNDTDLVSLGQIVEQWFLGQKKKTRVRP
ncbi:MAG: DUF4381 domain-containing protein [Deltaproteobacteria bacterium]|nr:DUF4381 domain-containing protein [Candidatus Tharpella sp.]